MATKTKKENPEEEIKQEKEEEGKEEEVKGERALFPKDKQYLYGVGGRKTAVAQVRLYKNGSGVVHVNSRSLEVYFPYPEAQEAVRSPLVRVGQGDKLDVSARVRGGGLRAQAEAVRHGLSRALVKLNPNFKKNLRRVGFLTRDARKKERKKPGLKRARRAPQWAKR